MAGATKRRSTRQAAGRKRSVYAEPDTDEDFDVDDGEEDYAPEEQHPPPPSKKRKTNTRKPVTRSKARSKRPLIAVGKARKPNSLALPEEKKQFAGPSDGHIPQWTSLPVDTLRDIFIFASRPTHYPHAEASANVSWLLRAARTCRSFALPALEAYYLSPSMLTSLDPHRLLELLRRPREDAYIDYKVKIKSISIDVRHLAYLASNRPAFDLAALAASLPQLQHMEIKHPMYLPPFRPLKLQRWSFPADKVLRAMNEHQIRLRSWRWSRDMIPKSDSEDLYSMLSKAHEDPVFSYLERLVVCGFNAGDSAEPVAPKDEEAGADTRVLPPGLTSSIAKLPSLQDLCFISCDVLMNNGLQQLPTNLRRLELSNCLEITSTMMRKYLSSSGENMRELVLDHNPALNLSFTQDLKTSCPKLEVLSMDLRYFSERVVTNDAVAFYDSLLAADEVPVWPPTLRHLEIVHAQKWSAEGAKNLFGSLVDGASELPELRILILHAHINIPWRDRVGFRDEWIGRLQRVFQRRCQEPSSWMGSFLQMKMRMKKQAQLGSDAPPTVSMTDSFAQVQVSPHKPTGDTDVDSGSDVPRASSKSQPRRSKRVADVQVRQASKSTTPTTESGSEEDGEETWRGQPEKFIQGLCRAVDVRIDNQRPRENQWTELDFLDSEASGDEDYHEGAENGYENADDERDAW